MDDRGVAAWVATVQAREKRRAEADAGLVGTAGPRDPADDWPGLDNMTAEQIRSVSWA